MARPSKIQIKWRKFKEAVARAAVGWVGDYDQKPAAGVERTSKNGGQTARMRAERPSRDVEDFIFIQEILALCPRIAHALEKLAADASVDENGDGRGWQAIVRVEPVDDSEEAAVKARETQRAMQRIANRFVRRTGIGHKTKSYIKKTLEAGNCFGELAIEIDEGTGLGAIVGIKEIPTWQTRPTSDGKGGVATYIQETTFDKDPVVWTNPNRIVHWKTDECDYHLLGLSLLLKLRPTWESFKLLDTNFWTSAHTQAVNPLIHKVGAGDGMGKVDIAAYQQRMEDQEGTSRNAYYIENGKAEIEVLNTGGGSTVIALAGARESVTLEFLESLGVPTAINGGAETGTNSRNKSAEQGKTYARWVNTARADFTAPLEKVFRIEFALKGYDLTEAGIDALGVGDVAIEFRWPDLSETRASRSKRLMGEFSGKAKSLRTVLYEMGEQDPDAEIARILEERKLGIGPAGPVVTPSPNGEQGPGVPSSEPDDEDEE